MQNYKLFCLHTASGQNLKFSSKCVQALQPLSISSSATTRPLVLQTKAAQLSRVHNLISGQTSIDFCHKLTKNLKPLYFTLSLRQGKGV